MPIDRRALKILFDTYWSPRGWKSAGVRDWSPDTPPDDLETAIRAGTMFRQRVLTHADAVRRTCDLRDSISPVRVGRVFLSSLLSGDIGLCSALGSYAVALRMPIHAASLQSASRCGICGDYEQGGSDLNVLNFERHKWGGVRHEQPSYMAFDLERFTVEAPDDAPPVDLPFLTRLVDAIDSMPAASKLADLVRALKPYIAGNDAQRRSIVSILGYAGVLRIPDHDGFFRSFTEAPNRRETPWHKDDWPYPIRWWRGGHGVDEEAMEFWFGLAPRSA